MRKRNNLGRFTSKEEQKNSENNESTFINAEMTSMQINFRFIKFTLLLFLFIIFSSPWIFIFYKKNLIWTVGNHVQNFFEESFSTCSYNDKFIKENNIKKEDINIIKDL